VVRHSLRLPSSTAGASITIKAAAKQYLKDVAPYNAAHNKFSSEASKWTGSITYAQMGKEATPFIAASETFQQKLLSQSWPTKAKRDVRTFYNAISPLEADLVTLSGVSSLSIENWLSTYNTNNSTATSDANLVRHDLGLPLVKF